MSGPNSTKMAALGKPPSESPNSPNAIMEDMVLSFMEMNAQDETEEEEDDLNNFKGKTKIMLNTWLNTYPQTVVDPGFPKQEEAKCSLCIETAMMYIFETVSRHHEKKRTRKEKDGRGKRRTEEQTAQKHKREAMTPRRSEEEMRGKREDKLDKAQAEVTVTLAAPRPKRSQRAPKKYEEISSSSSESESKQSNVLVHVASN